MTEKKSLKLSEEGINFLKKACANHKLAHEKEDQPYPWEILELIATYFKKNNDKYIDLIKTGVAKNGY